MILSEAREVRSLSSSTRIRGVRSNAESRVVRLSKSKRVGAATGRVFKDFSSFTNNVLKAGVGSRLEVGRERC